MQNLVEREEQTICAVSTPPGYGGISVLRVSGPQSLSIVQKMAPFLSLPKSHQAYFGVLQNPRNKEKIDDVLVTYFEKGRSYTGEEVVEISCHGNPFIVDQILRVLVELGALSAQRGEFSYRAFINGKIDLVQAEGVLSLIQSQSSSAQKIALRQLHGELSKKIQKIVDDLTWCLAHIEASIDFSTEGLETVSHAQLLETLNNILADVKLMVRSYESGRLIKEGVKIAIVGVPNVGKSSLLNLFVQSDKAIVTEQAGTTRDLIESDILFEGLRWTFVDTAGIRTSTKDQVERIGIERSKLAIQEADIHFFVFDLNQKISSEELLVLDQLDPRTTLILGNKSDLNCPPKEDIRVQMKSLSSKFFKSMHDEVRFWDERVFFVNTFDKKFREVLLKAASGLISRDIGLDEALISNARHFENISRAAEKIGASLEALEGKVGAEFVSVDLRAGLLSLQQTLGQHYDDQIMDRVFKEFCIGK